MVTYFMGTGAFISFILRSKGYLYYKRIFGEQKIGTNEVYECTNFLGIKGTIIPLPPGRPCWGGVIRLAASCYKNRS